jgi:hypothetical protein
MPENRKLPPRVTIIGCTPQYATKNPESAPQRAATMTDKMTAPQMFMPPSCHENAYDY